MGGAWAPVWSEESVAHVLLLLRDRSDQRGAGPVNSHRTMARRAEFLVYAVGVMLLGLFYHSPKQALSGPVFFLGTVVYLILLRLAGRLVSVRMGARHSQGERDA